MTICLFNVICVLSIAIISNLAIKDRIYVKGGEASKFVPFTCIYFLLLFFEMAFRGDFAIDTINFYNNFRNNYSAAYSINIFRLLADVSLGERGYIALNSIVHAFTDKYIYLLLVVALLIAIGYVRFIYLYSDMAWLSVLILFCSGSFYAGFNISQQILAVGLYVLCIKYLFEQKMIKWCVAIYLVTLFHISAVVLFPVYFILNFDLRKLSAGLKIALILCLSVLIYVCIPYCVNIALPILYPNRNLAELYGITWGTPLLSTLKAMVMGGFIILYIQKFDYDNVKDRIVINGTIVYLIFSVAGARIFMAQRFTHYFIPYLMLAYPMIIKRQKDYKNKIILTIIVVCMFIILNINPILRYGYYPFWKNQYIQWGF